MKGPVHVTYDSLAEKTMYKMKKVNTIFLSLWKKNDKMLFLKLCALGKTGRNGDKSGDRISIINCPLILIISSV